MLTKESANTLLKSLEEPPEHVVFVLATTNPEEVLPTIRSRTQHLRFSLLPHDELVGRLAELLDREGIEYDAEALETIATAAGGSARDAESLLDQAIAGADGHLDADTVAALFGSTPFALRAVVLDAIANEDAAGALVALGDLLGAGHEPRRVAEDLLVAARDAFVLSAGGGRVPVSAPAADQTRLQDLGERLGNAAVVRVIETLGQAIVDMRGVDAADPRLVLEVALVRLSRRDAGPPLQTVIERIERLERAGASRGDAPDRSAAPAPTDPAPARGPSRTVGALRASAQASPLPPAEPEPEPGPEPPAAPPTAAAEAGPLDLDDVIVAWAALLPTFSPATRAAVQAAQPLGVSDDVVTFGVASGLLEAARPRFKKEADTIRAALAQHLGRSVRFTIVADEGFTEVGGADRRSRPVADAPAPESEPELDPVDVEDGSDVVDAPPPEPEARLTEALGATVVDEVPRR